MDVAGLVAGLIRLASGPGRQECNSPASPIIANELHSSRPHPRCVPIAGTTSLANAGIKDPGGNAFSFAIIGEAGEKALPVGADSMNETGY